MTTKEAAALLIGNMPKGSSYFDVLEALTKLTGNIPVGIIWTSVGPGYDPETVKKGDRVLIELEFMPFDYTIPLETHIEMLEQLLTGLKKNLET